jgi:hypothetical protein
VNSPSAAAGRDLQTETAGESFAEPLTAEGLSRRLDACAGRRRPRKIYPTIFAAAGFNATAPRRRSETYGISTRQIGDRLHKITLATTLFLAGGLSAACGAKANVNVNVSAPTPARAAAQAPTPAAQTPTPAAPTAAPVVKQTTPDALVADLYNEKEEGNPFFQAEDRARVDKYFVKSTADLIWKDAVESKGEVGALEADPLYDAQDMEIKNFKVNPPETKGAGAEVPVTFDNFGKKQRIVFVLVSTDGGWKISDIKYSGGYTLVGMLKGM